MKKHQKSNHGTAASTRLTRSQNKTNRTTSNTETISRFFKKINVDKTEDQNQSLYKDAITNVESESTQKLNSSNASEGDFVSPKPAKKLAKIFTDAKTTVKKRTTRSKTGSKVSKKVAVEEETKLMKFAKSSDVNMEHLQLAMALSKSMEPELSGLQDNDTEDCYPSTQQIADNVKLDLFGYRLKSHQTQSQKDNVKVSKTVIARKKSKFRYKKPKLFTITSEEREKTIQEKIAQILSISLQYFDNNIQQSIKKPQIAKVHSLNLQNSLKLDSKLFKASQQINLDTNIDYYVHALNLDKTRGPCGCLLKNWELIAGRDKSPEKINLKELPKLVLHEEMKVKELKERQEIKSVENIISVRSIDNIVNIDIENKTKKVNVSHEVCLQIDNAGVAKNDNEIRIPIKYIKDTILEKKEMQELKNNEDSAIPLKCQSFNSMTSSYATASCSSYFSSVSQMCNNKSKKRKSMRSASPDLFGSSDDDTLEEDVFLSISQKHNSNIDETNKTNPSLLSVTQSERQHQTETTNEDIRNITNIANKFNNYGSVSLLSNLQLNNGHKQKDELNATIDQTKYEAINQTNNKSNPEEVDEFCEKSQHFCKSPSTNQKFKGIASASFLSNLRANETNDFILTNGLNVTDISKELNSSDVDFNDLNDSDNFVDDKGICTYEHFGDSDEQQFNCSGSDHSLFDMTNDNEPLNKTKKKTIANDASVINNLNEIDMEKVNHESITNEKTNEEQMIVEGVSDGYDINISDSIINDSYVDNNSLISNYGKSYTSTNMNVTNHVEKLLNSDTFVNDYKSICIEKYFNTTKVCETNELTNDKNSDYFNNLSPIKINEVMEEKRIQDGGNNTDNIVSEDQHYLKIISQNSDLGSKEKIVENVCIDLSQDSDSDTENPLIHNDESSRYLQEVEDSDGENDPELQEALRLSTIEVENDELRRLSQTNDKHDSDVSILADEGKQKGDFEVNNLSFEFSPTFSSLNHDDNLQVNLSNKQTQNGAFLRNKENDGFHVNNVFSDSFPSFNKSFDDFGLQKKDILLEHSKNKENTSTQNGDSCGHVINIPYDNLTNDNKQHSLQRHLSSRSIDSSISTNESICISDEELNYSCLNATPKPIKSTEDNLPWKYEKLAYKKNKFAISDSEDDDEDVAKNKKINAKRISFNVTKFLEERRIAQRSKQLNKTVVIDFADNSHKSESEKSVNSENAGNDDENDPELQEAMRLSVITAANDEMKRLSQSDATQNGYVTILEDGSPQNGGCEVNQRLVSSRLYPFNESLQLEISLNSTNKQNKDAGLLEDEENTNVPLDNTFSDSFPSFSNCDEFGRKINEIQLQSTKNNEKMLGKNADTSNEIGKVVVNKELSEDVNSRAMTGVGSVSMQISDDEIEMYDKNSEKLLVVVPLYKIQDGISCTSQNGGENDSNETILYIPSVSLDINEEDLEINTTTKETMSINHHTRFGNELIIDNFPSFDHDNYDHFAPDCIMPQINSTTPSKTKEFNSGQSPKQQRQLNKSLTIPDNEQNKNVGAEDIVPDEFDLLVQCNDSIFNKTNIKPRRVQELIGQNVTNKQLSNKTPTKQLNATNYINNKTINKRTSMFEDTLANLLEQTNVLQNLQQIENGHNIERVDDLKTPPRHKTDVTCNLGNLGNCSLVNPITPTTPADGIYVKTTNITPMPIFDAMTTPEIHMELDKIGVKQMKRRRGVQMLKHVYNSMHLNLQTRFNVNQDNDENVEIDTDDLNRPNKRRKKLEYNCDDNDTPSAASVVNPQVFQEGKIEVNGHLSDCEALGDMIFERKQSKRIKSCALPFHIAWHNFLCVNREIWENVLLYEPLQVEVLYAMFKELGFKYHIQDMIGFFDKKCITIRIKQNN